MIVTGFSKALASLRPVSIIGRFDHHASLSSGGMGMTTAQDEQRRDLYAVE